MADRAGRLASWGRLLPPSVQLFRSFSCEALPLAASRRVSANFSALANRCLLAQKGFKGLLRRIPILGALLAGLGAGSDILDSESDDGLSRLDKDKRAGKAIGGALGTLGGAALGAAIGTAIAPGLGTVIGGIIGGFLGDQGGQIIGEKMGEWVNDLRAYDIPGKVVTAFYRSRELLQDRLDGRRRAVQGRGRRS